MARATRRQGGGQQQKRRASRVRAAQLEQLNLNAAGIDVGATEHWVAVPADRDAQPVQRFGAFTADLLANSHSALGAYYRRMRGRLGAPKAITATAHKLARLVYSMLRYGTAYVDEGQQAYEQKYRDRVLTNLQRKAKAFGYQLVHVADIDGEVASTL